MRMRDSVLTKKVDLTCSSLTEKKRTYLVSETGSVILFWIFTIHVLERLISHDLT